MISMIAPLVVALAVGWPSVLIAAPHLPVALAGFLYVFGSVICHQIADRSFHIEGAQLPVCARCLGIYVGGAAGAIAALSFRGASLIGLATRTREGSRHRRETDPLLLLCAAAAPTALTLALELTGIWQPSNLVRAAAGMPVGVVVALLVMATLRRPALHYEQCTPRRPLASSPPPTHF